MHESINNSLINNTGMYAYGGIDLNTNSNYNTVINNNISFVDIGYYIKNNCSNNILTNNSVKIDIMSGFEISSNSNNNILLSNKATNGIIGFEIYSKSDNNILLNNNATNGEIGIEITDYSNNTILKNNIAIGNANDFVYTNDCQNTTLINNTFIVTNNGSSYFASQSQFNVTTIFFVLLLIGICCGIIYSYYSSKTKNIILEKSKENQNETNERQNSDMTPILFLGLLNILLVIAILITKISFISITLKPVTYFVPTTPFVLSITGINKSIFQFSPLIEILLIGGGIEIFISSLIFQACNSYGRLKIAKIFSLIGLITQLMSLVLISLLLFDLNNSINSTLKIIKATASDYYIINLGLAFYIYFIAILLSLATYLVERNEVNNHFKKVS